MTFNPLFGRKNYLIKICIIETHTSTPSSVLQRLKFDLYFLFGAFPVLSWWMGANLMAPFTIGPGIVTNG